MVKLNKTVALAAVAVASILLARGQAANRNALIAAQLHTTEPAPLPMQAGQAGQTGDEVVREIRDPYSGNHWLLVRDLNDRGGPGRLVLLAHGASVSPAGDRPVAAAAAMPVIHAGDALVVEEHTAILDARLEALALGTAVMGAEFKARLKVGGKVVRVLALGVGRAGLVPVNEVQQ